MASLFYYSNNCSRSVLQKLAASGKYNAKPLREQLFELKMKTPLKNLRI
jgi:hypothetical protein